MKNWLFALVFIMGAYASAQPLANTKWYIIKVEFQESGISWEPKLHEILTFNDQNATFIGPRPLIYYTKIEDGYEIGPVNADIFRMANRKYTIDENLISLNAPQEKAQIVFQDDTLLVINYADYKSSYSFFGNPTFYCIHNNFYFEYIKEKDLVSYSQEGYIECSMHLFPIYRGSIKGFLSSDLTKMLKGDTIHGTFLLNSDGVLLDILINVESDRIRTDDITKIKNIFKETSGKWIIPNLNGGILKVPFDLKKKKWWDSNHYPLQFITKSKHIIDTTIYSQDPPVEDYAKAYEYFERGNVLLRSKKFEQALVMFNKSIELNPRYLDSFYNKALALYSLNRKQEACAIWESLAARGERQASVLVSKYCKAEN